MHSAQRLTHCAVLAALLLRPWPAAGAGQPSTPDGNAVTRWNTIATAAVLVDPGRVRDSRTMAMVHAAIHDAVNAIDRRYEPYTSDLLRQLARSTRRLRPPPMTCSSYCRRAGRRLPMPSTRPPSPRFPMVRRRAPAFGLVSGARWTPSTVGLRMGWPTQLCRCTSLQARPETMTLPRPSTSPCFLVGADSLPWGINLENHRVPGPDPLDGLQYALDFNYLKAIGSLNSPWRTTDQTEIARFWGDGSTRRLEPDR